MAGSLPAANRPANNASLNSGDMRGELQEVIDFINNTMLAGATTPSSIGSSASIGTSEEVARVDHVHDLGSAFPGAKHFEDTYSISSLASDATVTNTVALGDTYNFGIIVTRATGQNVAWIGVCTKTSANDAAGAGSTGGATYLTIRLLYGGDAYLSAKTFGSGTVRLNDVYFDSTNIKFVWANVGSGSSWSSTAYSTIIAFKGAN